MELLETIEVLREEEASVRALFGGSNRRPRSRAQDPAYMAKLAEAASLVAQVANGRLPVHYLSEAMSTSDFPQLFTDILDRGVLGSYRETPSTYQNYTKVNTSIRDFRDVKRFRVDGAESRLEEVAEQAEYPEASLSDDVYTYAVKKYGRKLAFSFEALTNDDLDLLKSGPERLGRGARRSEEYFATSLFVGTAGPHASMYDAGTYGNVVTSNPVLSIAGLQTAFTILGSMEDSDGEPIDIDAVHLVVPSALEITAMNILNAVNLRTTTAGGATNQELEVANWMKNKTQLHVNRQIANIANTNATTSWFLFAEPADRPAIEIGFLAGHREPEVRQKASDIEGGSAVDGDFDTDSVQWRVRHIFGGGRMDPKMTVASNGSGS